MNGYKADTRPYYFIAPADRFNTFSNMIQSQISETLYWESSDKFVKLTQRKTLLDIKTLFVPLDIVKTTMEYANFLKLGGPGERCLFERNGWKVTVSDDQDKTYVCFNRLNRLGTGDM